MEYSAKVMDHFMNPRNVGEIENASGVGQVGNMKCGDIMKVYLQIEDNKIIDAKFKLPDITPPIIGTAFETPLATVVFVTVTPTAFPICFITELLFP